MSEIYDLLRNNKNKTYCFFDAETSNLCLSECCNLPWQISMITVKGQTIENEFDFFIKWPQGLKVSAQSAAITNFSQKTIDEKGIAPEKVFAEVDRELNKANIIAGHNILGFDAYVIQFFYRLLGKPAFNIIPKALDTFPIAKAIKLNIPYNKKENFAAWQYRLYHHKAKGLRCSLGALGKEYEIAHDYETLHNSLSDLKLNIKVWNKQKLQIDL